MEILVYLNGIISQTGFAGGISINRELEKNSNLLLASRFFGILAAESLTVRRRCNRFTCSFCGNKTNKTKQNNVNANAHQERVIFRGVCFLGALTISGSLGHSILENKRPSFLALARMFHVSSCSLQTEGFNKSSHETLN